MHCRELSRFVFNEAIKGALFVHDIGVQVIRNDFLCMLEGQDVFPDICMILDYKM